jgi:hypothetical protein
MKLVSTFKNMSMPEIVVAVVFILYAVLPIETPRMVANLVDTSVGMVAVLAVVVYLFMNANPVLAAISLFAAYELLRRSAAKTGVQIVTQYTPSQRKKDAKMKEMNPPKTTSLEEEVVSQMAPLGATKGGEYVTSSFSPVADEVGSASMFE